MQKMSIVVPKVFVMVMKLGDTDLGSKTHLFIQIL